MSIGDRWKEALGEKDWTLVRDNIVARRELVEQLEAEAGAYFAGLRDRLLQDYILVAGERGSACTGIEVDAALAGTRAFRLFQEWGAAEGIDVAVGAAPPQSTTSMVLLSLAPAEVS